MRSRRKFSRRSILRGIALAGVSSRLPLPAFALDSGGFVLTSAAPPDNPLNAPPPPTPASEGSSPTAFDNFGNYWCIGPADDSGNRPLLVLPAQAPHRWLADHISALPPHPWAFVGADEFGFVWVASATRCMRLDPHLPEAHWLDLSGSQIGLATEQRTTAMGIGPDGAIMLALATGGIIELDYADKLLVTHMETPPNADTLLCDDTGRLWLRCGDKTYTRPPAPDAWQRIWELVDRLPASNHDLSGDILGDCFYMAGGQNGGWGYPARPHVFHDLLEFNARTRTWRIIAALDQPRFYNGTSCLDDKVWVIGGFTRDAIGNPVLLSSVEIFDPATGNATPGPPLPTRMVNPVALHCSGRIYVAAFVAMDKDEHPCRLLSIGSGETSWRSEPSGPAYKTAFAGTSHAGSIYVALGSKGLGRFDTNTRSWTLIPHPDTPRSPQLATYQGEIWIMGGRDIEREQRTVIYSPLTGQWRNGPDLPRPLAWGAGTTVGGRLLVIGGAGGRGYSNRAFLLRQSPIA